MNYNDLQNASMQYKQQTDQIGSQAEQQSAEVMRQYEQLSQQLDDQYQQLQQHLTDEIEKFHTQECNNKHQEFHARLKEYYDQSAYNLQQKYVELFNQLNTLNQQRIQQLDQQKQQIISQVNNYQDADERDKVMKDIDCYTKDTEHRISKCHDDAMKGMQKHHLHHANIIQDGYIHAKHEHIYPVDCYAHCGHGDKPVMVCNKCKYDPSPVYIEDVINELVLSKAACTDDASPVVLYDDYVVYSTYGELLRQAAADIIRPYADRVYVMNTRCMATQDASSFKLRPWSLIVSTPEKAAIFTQGRSPLFIYRKGDTQDFQSMEGNIILLNDIDQVKLGVALTNAIRYYAFVYNPDIDDKYKDLSDRQLSLNDDELQAIQYIMQNSKDPDSITPCANLNSSIYELIKKQLPLDAVSYNTDTEDVMLDNTPASCIIARGLKSGIGTLYLNVSGVYMQDTKEYMYSLESIHDLAGTVLAVYNVLIDNNIPASAVCLSDTVRAILQLNLGNLDLNDEACMQVNKFIG